jgi:hypothetical protein
MFDDWFWNVSKFSAVGALCAAAFLWSYVSVRQQIAVCNHDGGIYTGWCQRPLVRN